MIQWYPGHMAKALREIDENLRFVDLVMILVDARIPASSLNPEILKRMQNKATLFILTKEDKASSELTKKWCLTLAGENNQAISINAKDQKARAMVLKAVEALMKPWHEKNAAKGLRKKAVRTMVVGNPNVGKSTLINLLAGRKAASVGDKPGVTKTQQWIKIGDELELLDTPGVLWPKFENDTTGFNLALTGAIKDEVVPLEDLILYAIGLFNQIDSQVLNRRYGLDSTDPVIFLKSLSESKKISDPHKLYHLILTDYRNGLLGRMTLEEPHE